MSETKSVTSSNPQEYGWVTNGRAAGCGYDCEIKRVSETSAIANLMSPDRHWDGLAMVDIGPDTDLQNLALEYANNCHFAEFVRIDDDGDAWDRLADQWNSISVTPTPRKILASAGARGRSSSMHSSERYT